MEVQIVRSAIWMVLSKGGIQTLSFLSTMFVARWLSPSDYGLMAIAGAWISIISLLAELGLGGAIIQFRDLTERELNACFWVAIGLAIVSYVGIFLIAPSIGEWFQSPRLPLIIQISSVSILLIAIRVVPDSLLRKSLRLDKVSQAEILASVVTIPLVMALAWAGAGVWSLVIGTISTPLVQSIATMWFLQWWPGLSVGGERLKSIFHYSVTSIGSRLCWAAYSQADTVILGKVAGETVVGLYSMGKQIGTLAASKVSTVVNQLALPVMAELQSDPVAMRQAILRSMRLVATITCPLGIGTLILADPLVRVFLTEKWIDTVPLVQVFCGYAVFRSLDMLFPPVLYARYRASFMLWYGVVLLLCMPIAFYIGAVLLGSLGVVLAWILMYPIIAYRMIVEALSEIHLNWHDLWRETWEAVLPTAVMACAVFPISHWALEAQLGRSAWLHLISTALFGVAVYVIAIFYRGGQLKQDMSLAISRVTQHRIFG